MTDTITLVDVTRDYGVSLRSGFAAQVSAGARFLDAHVPGWVDLIDLPALDLSRMCNCVIGQIFGDFREVVSSPPASITPTASGASFLIAIDAACALGFDAEREDDDVQVLDRDGWDMEYEILQARWEMEIEARRAHPLRLPRRTRRPHDA